MADTALTALTATTTLASGDLFYVVDGVNSRKVDWEDVLTNLSVTESQISDFGAYQDQIDTINTKLPVPDYANAGGTGDRTSDIGVAASVSLLSGSGPASNLVNGGVESTYTDSITLNAISVSGLSIEFDFGRGARRVISEATWKQSATSTHGVWKWQGSDDGSAWSDIGASFTLGGATSQIQTELSANGDGYQLYRLLGVSGTASASDYIQEVEFKIDGTAADGVISAPDTVFHDPNGGAPGFLSKLISAWTFNENDGDIVYDRKGFSNIDLTTPTTPNATRTAQGVRLENGLIQTPSITGAKQIIMLYRTGLDETGGFLISGGGSSGNGFLQENVGTIDTARYAGSGYGWHAVASRASSGAAAYELTRGGWGLLSRDMASSYDTIIGLGGRHSTTTSRCPTFEIAMAFVFDTTLSSAEEDALLGWVRREGVKRGIYIHRDDCPVKEDLHLVVGESTADGRSTLTDLSAADQALDLSRFASIIPGNQSTDWNRWDGFELGFNQQTTDPANDFGPEFGVAFQRRAEAATIERQARILKFAKGSTFLAPSSVTGVVSSTSWNVNELNTSGLFWRMISHTQRGLQEMLTQGIGWDGLRVGFLIGLNDAVSTSYTTDAATYQGYLQDFLDQIEAELFGETVTMFLFRAHNSDPSSDATALGHVRTASDSFGTANANVTTVDTDAFGLEPDEVHYNAAASKSMGITIHG